MISPMSQTLDDNDLDDEALWTLIDSAAAVSAAKSLKPQNNHYQSPKIIFPAISSSPSPQSITTNPRNQSTVNGEVFNDESFTDQRRKKIARVCRSDSNGYPSPPLAMVKHVPRTPTSSSYCSDYQIQSPVNFESHDCSHSLAGRFPTVAIFKEYQNAAMAILEKGDYTMISGNPLIKKSGWRKISFFFNISYEIKDKTIEFDDNRNVQRAEFIVRAHMQGGRFSDGWGSCERREKKFSKPNHDIPSTAETRAKNKACQDLLGIGEYRPGVNAQR